MNIIVRASTPEDLEWIIQADRQFPHPWQASDWRELGPAKYCFVVEVDQKLVGYSLFQYLEHDIQAHLLKIYLDPETRNSGMALKLFDYSVQTLDCGEVFLEVGESNVAAQRFYEKIGFQRVHLAKNFYSDGENAWLMLLTR